MYARPLARSAPVRWAAILATVALVAQPIAVASAQPADPGGTTVHEIVADWTTISTPSGSVSQS